MCVCVCVRVCVRETKMMLTGCPEAEDNKPIQLENGAIAAVDNFTYLGSNITNDGEQGWKRLQEHLDV